MIIKKTKKAFSLIELIIYVAIASMVMVAVLQVGLNLIIDRSITQSKRGLYLNARSVMNQLQYEIKAADDVLTGSSTFGSNPGVLTLSFPGNNDVIFDTYLHDVTIGGQTISITTLRIKEGNSAYVDLTTDKANVTDFTLTNLTRGSESKNINIALTLETTNPGNDTKYDESISLETAVSIRR